MGKKKDGSASGSKTAGGIPKLPKRIGSVTLPKELRKSGDRLIAKANSPEGRQAITAGLAMAATALAAARVRSDTARAAATPDKPGQAAPAPTGDPFGAIADMVMAKVFPGKR